MADIRIQHVHVPTNTLDTVLVGGVDFTTVSDVARAFILPASNTRSICVSDSTSTTEGAANSGTARFLGPDAILINRPPTVGASADIRFWIVEFTGMPGSPDEFIVRLRVEQVLTAGTTPDVVPYDTLPADPDRCVPFHSIRTNDTTNGWPNMGCALYCDAAGLHAQRSGGVQVTTMSCDVVEFLGSNWGVGHGDSGLTAADTGTIILNTAGDGVSGSTFDVADWARGLIWHTFHADLDSNTNAAIADNAAFYEPTPAFTDRVDWEFHAHHDGVDNRHRVHVLTHPNLTVTRFSDTSSSAGETAIDITSAGLTDLSAALVTGSSHTSGGGTAYARGMRQYYLNSLTEAAHWCGRAGNAMQHRLQVVNFAAVEGEYEVDVTPTSTARRWRKKTNPNEKRSNIRSRPTFAYNPTTSSFGDTDVDTTFEGNRHVALPGLGVTTVGTDLELLGPEGLLIATMTITPQQLSGTWNDLVTLAPSQAATPPRSWEWTFATATAQVSVVAKLRLLNGGPKWDFDLNVLLPGTYRLKIDLVTPAGIPLLRTYYRDPYDTGSQVVGGNWRHATDHKQTLKLNFSDIAEIDLASVTPAANSCEILTAATTVTQTYDPTINADAAYAAHVVDGLGRIEDGATHIVGRLFSSQTHLGWRFDITSLPTGDDVDDVDLQFDIDSVVGTPDTFNVHGWGGDGQGDPETDSDANFLTNSAAGTAYTTFDGTSAGSQTLDLGATADSDVEAARDAGTTFAIGVHMDNDTTGGDRNDVMDNSGDPATLIIVHSTPGGGGISHFLPLLGVG